MAKRTRFEIQCDASAEAILVPWFLEIAAKAGRVSASRCAGITYLENQAVAEECGSSDDLDFMHSSTTPLHIELGA